MRVTIINTAFAHLNMGMRYLSSYLKSKGHEVRLVFFPYENPFVETNAEKERAKQEKLFDELLKICENSDLIGVSLMTLDFNASVRVSKFLKEKTGKTIIWGGIHPTLCPEECLEHADIVCVGDGEEPLLQLVQKLEAGEDYANIAGLWVKKDGQTFANPIIEIKDNLDDFPPMDFDLEGKWVIAGDDLVPLNADLQKSFFAQTHLTLKDGSPCYTYVTQASRGCPHRCAYCSNAFFLDKFKGKGKVLRRRGTQAVVNELKAVREKYPYVNAVNFYDDTFFATTDEAIEEFSAVYKKEVGMPFFALASPLTLSERKLEALLDAGLGHVQMGVQTGSERLNKEVFKRPIANALTLEKMRLMNKHKERITPQYDFILDCPYETDDDKLENVRFISQIPKPYKIQLFSLVLYPHTELYERAVADGIYKEELGGKKKLLAKFAYLNSFDFYSFAVGLAPNIPSRIYRVYTLKPVFKLLNQRRLAFLFRFLIKLGVKLNKRFHFTKKIVVNN